VPPFHRPAEGFGVFNPLLHAGADTVDEVDNSGVGDRGPSQSGSDALLALERISIIEDLRVKEVTGDRGLAAR
jgi:hypothetical protein